MLIHWGEDIDWFEDSFEEISFFRWGFLDHLTENHPIEFVKLSWSLADDSGCSGSIVHQSQLTEGFSMFIGLQVGLVAFDHFRTIVLSTLDDKKLISSFTFFDHHVPSGEFVLWHGLYQNFFIFPIQILEEDRISDQRFDQKLSLKAFGDLCEDHRLFFVVETKGFFGDGHSAPRFPLHLFLLDLCLQLGHSFFLFLPLRVWFPFLLVFFCVGFEPSDGEGHWIGRSFLDDVVDKGLDEQIDGWVDVLLDLQLLLFHINYFRKSKFNTV